VKVALLLTIWAALVAFVAAEAARRRSRETGLPPARWSTSAAAIGLALLVAHIAIAFGTRHDWSHAAAMRETARQTLDVYGLDWGGGVFVNYAFALAWAIDTWRWHVSPARAAGRSAGATLALRAFYGLVIANASVVFVPAPRRWMGVAIVAALGWIWRPVTRRPEHLV